MGQGGLERKIISLYRVFQNVLFMNRASLRGPLRSQGIKAGLQPQRATTVNALAPCLAR